MPRGAECLAVGIFSAFHAPQPHAAESRMVGRFEGGGGEDLMLSFVEVLALVRMVGTHHRYAPGSA